jgi:RNA polymerase-binding transcription factor DksA
MRRQVSAGTTRKTLLERRRSLLSVRNAALDAESILLAELEPDVFDTAADVTGARALDRLGEIERLELDRIGRALERIAAGTYGTCAGCGEPIPAARLRVVPEADRCTHCARINSEFPLSAQH